MTRINCIPVEELTSKHLLAEYRELPRVFRLARHLRAEEYVPCYTLGAGHVKFFYDKLKYLANRFDEISFELRSRGYCLKHLSVQEYLRLPKFEGLCNDWFPDELAMQRNRARIELRLSEAKQRVTNNKK